MNFGSFTLEEFVELMLKYFRETEPGTFRDTVVAKQPIIFPGEVNADLHTHPYISSKEDFQDTLDILVDHNVDICALTTHGTGNQREMNFFQVRNALSKWGFAKNLHFADNLAFQLSHRDKKVTFVPAYEMYVTLDGIKGRIDMITLMPDKGFEVEVQEGMNFHDYLKLNKKYSGILIATHPYTIWDPYGPFGFFAFRLATPDDREIIKKKVFPNVDTIDRVSTNCAWMVKSDELAEQDYQGKTLCNSDAHSTCHYTRNEIGRSGNIFKIRPGENGKKLRSQLRNCIVESEFRTYHNYSPSGQFLLGVAMPSPKEGFP